MKHSSGRIEVICGGMFSGKTEELIRRIRRAIIAGQTVQVFKPQIDTRHGIEEIISHNGQRTEAVSVPDASQILPMVEEETTVVAIDEAQFFSSDVVTVAEQLADDDIRVLIAGLDTDFRGEPFGCMPDLLCRAEEVIKLNAICVICGNPASRTQRLVDGKPAYYDDPIILVGAHESYQPRCRKHHIVRESISAVDPITDKL